MKSRTGTIARIAAACLLLAGCAAPPAAAPKPDPARDADYARAIDELAVIGRQAGDLMQRGQTVEAAAEIARGLPLQTRLLAAPRPTLAAMEAVSDLDDLYARVLLANHHDGYARTLYQKNLARWKVWKPQTADTARRMRQAQDGIAECDRRLKQ